jgi:hypothetical protein
MKKMYLFASMLLFVGGTFAQQKSSTYNNLKAVPSKAQNTTVKVANENNVGASANYSPEDVVFEEDFANGYDGNNGIGPWTFGGPQGDVWEISIDGPTGQFSDNIGPLESATADNGFALIDCDLWNTDPNTGGPTGNNVNGWIESPVLDFSDLGSVLVDYTTYYRWCCFQSYPVFISASNDGGATWTNFVLNNFAQFIEGANNNSGTLNVTTDISSIAANESNVKIRFAYVADEAETGTSYSHYFLGVDDIVIYENPFENNLSVLQVMNGDVFDLWEFKNSPIEQADDLTFGVVYGNFGSADQTGASVTWEVMSNGSVLHTSTLDIGDLPTFRLVNGKILEYDTLFVESGYTLPAVGTYTIRTTIAANEEEQNPTTNIMERIIQVTHSVMSHDDLDLLNIQTGPRAHPDGGFREAGFGTYHFVTKEGSKAYGFQVVFGNNTTIGANARFQLYEVGEDGLNATEDNMPASSPLAEVEYFVSAADTSVNTFVLFDDPVDLEVGKIYFASVRQFLGNDEVWMMGTDNTDSDNSSWTRDLTGSQVDAWFSDPIELAVRLGFSETTAINEIAKQEINLTLAPNPANDYTVVSYELKDAKKVEYTMYDVNGRVIVRDDLGSQTSGVHRITINTSAYDSGVYYMILTVGESTVSEKIVITR